MSGRRANRRRSPLVPILLVLVALGLVIWGIVWLAGDVTGHVEPPVVDDPVVDDPVVDDPVPPDDENKDDEEAPEVPEGPISTKMACCSSLPWAAMCKPTAIKAAQSLLGICCW